MLRREPNRGFFVTPQLSVRHTSPDLSRPFLSDEARYMRLADDRLAGLLPDRVTESELMRRYALTRAGLAKILDRASGEGWMARRPGQGWDFLPMLDSSDALAQSYRFRIAFEPAALLEPTFQVDHEAFNQFRDHISKMANGVLAPLSKAEIFAIGSSFHEMLMKCSGNDFFLSAIQRINRLRRLVEYRKAIDHPRLMRESREHLVLLDMLEEGNREEASLFLRQHLTIALRAKTKS
jgi:DNA-binding GntR family transcriptional regulator